ncbi:MULTISPECIES: transposase [unclassified Flavobacterium]|uniref:transposase n=1 Tax=unclassified Flavobacterium TaxID=196869 RepID=UPI00131D785B|nr:MULTISPECIES: transposase [unclassified Flavobacterium]
MKKFQNKYRIPSARLQNWDYGENGAYFITICIDKMECLFGDVVSKLDVSNANVETLLIASLQDTIDEKCEMQLNELGKIAHDIWDEIPNKFPFVELGNFVIMPNHMHGILIINKLVKTRLIAFENENVENANGNAHVETRLIASKNENVENANRNERVETRLIASKNENVENVNRNERVETRLIASEHEEDDKKGGFSGNNNPMFHENISRIIRWYKGRCSFEMRKIHADFNWQSRFYDHVIRDSRAFDTIQNYIEDNPSKWKKDKFHN